MHRDVQRVIGHAPHSTAARIRFQHAVRRNAYYCNVERVIGLATDFVTGPFDFVIRRPCDRIVCCLLCTVNLCM